MRRGLQPHVPEAATLCAGGCNPIMCRVLPFMHRRPTPTPNPTPTPTPNPHQVQLGGALCLSCVVTSAGELPASLVSRACQARRK